MNQRQRRFIGVIVTVVFLIVYVLVAMALAGDYAVGHGIWVELPAFIILGIGWLPVVMWLIVWMSRSKAD